ncbi:MAG: glycoside hydrolase family 13 protein [Oscillospiraceae bacterium]|nr:glycoside hydrolase family 13 protein [Oscillospiraceae bacterium]
MRILFDSQQAMYKTPFGTLTQGQVCCLHIHIPSTVGATRAECILDFEDGTPGQVVLMTLTEKRGAYDIFSGSFAMDQPGLFFYYFRIYKQESSFRLFKQGHDTNMEAGDRWQLTCIPADFTTPDWAKGAVIYQVFPDRFCKVGSPSLSGKLEPYRVHKNWSDDVDWKPNEKGEVLNNDFFGGNFRGITEKMDYIASLGTTILYLNPISKSFSSHRYDTGDYKSPDPMLGTIEDFQELCDAAHIRGIRVILDGVYSHTGSDSLYFDREGHFGRKGAYTDPNSPYRSWYTFNHYPDSYNSWWGFHTLPTVNKMDPAFLDYIIDAEDSVVAHWLNLGADGFRLDVVDELPNEFVLRLKQRIRQIRPDALLIGEVWEDASNKIAYNVRRRYFVDGVLDSSMNYPFRKAILQFMQGLDDGNAFREAVMTIAENYPPQVLACNMNLLSTHDTPRILTALVDDFEGTREVCATRHLSEDQRKLAEDRLLMASFLQFMLPGAPSIYYGDEAGMEGHKDPFNRRPYPWGRENEKLLTHYRNLGALRKAEDSLCLGDIHFTQAGDQKLAFTRNWGGRQLKIYVNRGADCWDIPAGKVLLGHRLETVTPKWLCVGSMGFCVTEEV